MAENDFFFRGNKIDVIPQLLTGNFGLSIDIKYFL